MAWKRYLETTLWIGLIGFILALSGYAVQFVRGQGQQGNMCGADDNSPCLVPILGAGWPRPYVVDNPNISVYGSLDWASDGLNPVAFLWNALFYCAAVAIFVAVKAEIERRMDARAKQN